MGIIMVSEAAATAIFTITRLFYNSILGAVTIILFSKLPGGSSAKFWYDQPDAISKLTSFFLHPFGPTGKYGVRSTNVIALVCMTLAALLNIMPTILSKLSPITVGLIDGPINATLSPISNIFIPTLTDINIPGLSNPSTSEMATTKFLCSYITNGCTDAKNNVLAKVIWDQVEAYPIEFFRSSSFPNTTTDNNTSADNTMLLVSINDTLSAPSTPTQYIFLAKQTFNGNLSAAMDDTGSFAEWNGNNFTGFFINPTHNNNSGSAMTAYDYLHSDQIYPVNTPDLSDLLRQGQQSNAPATSSATIERAERWSAIHRTETLSTVLWQTANTHTGTVNVTTQDLWGTTIPQSSGNSNSDACFFCNILDIAPNSTLETTIKNAVLNATPNSSFVTIQSYVDQQYRLTTTMCTLQQLVVPEQQMNGSISYSCMHTYTQLWSILHLHNPYSLLDSNTTDGSDSSSFLDSSTTPFPYFPPPSNLSTNRTYVPIVPIFEIRSRSTCYFPWDFTTTSVQSWMNSCATSTLGQISILDLDHIALNVWQLGSTITVGGFLVTAQYFDHTVGIAIDTVVQIIIAIGVGCALLGSLVVVWVTTPIHRSSLYEVVREMLPYSSDQYGKVRRDQDAPTNTLRLVGSVVDKKRAYLMLNNRAVVTMSDEYTTVNNSIIALTHHHDQEKNIQKNWSRRQLIKF